MGIAYNAGAYASTNWVITETEFISEYQRKFETIFCLGNGYMGLRSTTEEEYHGANRGFYVAGLFDAFPGEVTELPNIADWTSAEITLDGEVFNLSRGTAYGYRRQLHLKTGEVIRKLEWESPSGKRTRLVFRRFVSISNIHIAAIKIEITPINYSGKITLFSGINGQTTNSGVQHFKEGSARFFQDNTVTLTSRTQESGIGLSLAVSHLFAKDGSRIVVQEKVTTGRRQIFLSSEHDIRQEETLGMDIIAAVHTSRDPAWRTKEKLSDKELGAITKRELEKATEGGYEKLFTNHAEAWEQIWKKHDVYIDGPDFDQLAIRFSLFHIYQMTPVHDELVSIAAKGLSGDGYKGHFFWDTEIFLLPVHTYTSPEIARELLLYRYHSLAGARKKAGENGYAGAMYPWESADTGEEATPKWGGVDIKTGKPIRIWSGDLELHITCDIVYSIWQYFNVTGDYDFMYGSGLEIMLDTSRFWSSRLEYNNKEDHYEITGIMGPDEYSEHIHNNAFTNYMVKWQIDKTLRFSRWVKENKPGVWEKVSAKLELSQEELDSWKEKGEKLFFPMDQESGFITQYEGFKDKKIIDLLQYKEKVGSILEDFSWENIIQSQIIKQADVIMLFHLVGKDFSKEVKKVNWNYYEPKTLHDSSLSHGIHAIVAADMDEIQKGYDFFQKSIRIDLGENMHSCDDGLHAASHGGNWQAVVNGFGGMRVTDDGILRINPGLPDQWKNLSFNLTWRGTACHLHISKRELSIQLFSVPAKPFSVDVFGDIYHIQTMEVLRIPYGCKR